MSMRCLALQLGFWALLTSAPQLLAQELPADYRAVASAFRQRVIETNRATITQMDLGRIALDTNRFTALVTNQSDAARTLGLSLRAVPGLWVRRM